MILIIAPEAEVNKQLYIRAVNRSPKEDFTIHLWTVQAIFRNFWSFPQLIPSELKYFHSRQVV